MGADRPLRIVQVEHRRYRNNIHVSFVERFQGSHIAPVECFFFVFVYKVERVDAVFVDHLGKDILAKIMARVRVFGIFKQHRNEHVCIEYVNAHRTRNHCGVVGGTNIRLLRFFQKAGDPAEAVNFYHAETIRLGRIHQNRGNRYVRV